jgi:hypothetical protein
MTGQEAKELLAAYQDVSYDLYRAVRLAQDMMLANDLSLPRTFEVIDDAVSQYRSVVSE